MARRGIRCTIEMDLIEGTHFNQFDLPISDLTAQSIAIEAFLDLVNNLDNAGDLAEYVQTVVIEDVS